MANVKDFALWFFTQLPTFLMSEPIKYFVGLALLLCVVGVFIKIIHIR